MVAALSFPFKDTVPLDCSLAPGAETDAFNLLSVGNVQSVVQRLSEWTN